MEVTRQRQDGAVLPETLPSAATARRTTSHKRSDAVQNVPAIFVTPKTFVSSDEVPRKPDAPPDWVKQAMKTLWSDGKIDYAPFEAVGRDQRVFAVYVPEQSVGDGKTTPEWIDDMRIWGRASRLYIETHRFPEDAHLVRVAKVVMTGGG